VEFHVLPESDLLSSVPGQEEGYVLLYSGKRGEIDVVHPLEHGPL